MSLALANALIERVKAKAAEMGSKWSLPSRTRPEGL